MGAGHPADGAGTSDVWTFVKVDQRVKSAVDFPARVPGESGDGHHDDTLLSPEGLKREKTFPTGEFTDN